MNIYCPNMKQSIYANKIPKNGFYTFVVPLVKQPPKKIIIDNVYDGSTQIIFTGHNNKIISLNHYIAYTKKSYTIKSYTIKKKYPLDSEVGIKEVYEWEFPHSKETSMVLYKADGLTLYYPCQKWRSPVTMSDKMIRWKGIVIENKVYEFSKTPLKHIPVVLTALNDWSKKEFLELYLSNYSRRKIKPNKYDYIECVTVRRTL